MGLVLFFLGVARSLNCCRGRVSSRCNNEGGVASTFLSFVRDEDNFVRGNMDKDLAITPWFAQTCCVARAPVLLALGTACATWYL